MTQQPERVITTEPEVIQFAEGLEIVWHMSRTRPVLADHAPGPAPRVSAAPPDAGKGSRPRR